MSRVGSVGGPAAPVRAGRAGRADGRFGATLDATSSTSDAREAIAAGGVMTAAALLSLQEMADATTRNRRARVSACEMRENVNEFSKPVDLVLS